jgi:hypothetical protein
MNGEDTFMIYFADEFGRYSHSRLDLSLQTYIDLGFIPSHVTEEPPLAAKAGFDVIFNGSSWEYFAVDLVEHH